MLVAVRARAGAAQVDELSRLKVESEKAANGRSGVWLERSTESD